MSSHPAVTLSDSADPDLRSRIQRVLRQYNAPHGVTSPDARPLVASANGSDGAFVGGCVAETFWGWLVIDVLAVEEDHRGAGVGTSLVDAVEAAARGRGCTRAHTSAWAFQGLSFWRSRGYNIVGKLADYPPGHTYHWLQREL